MYTVTTSAVNSIATRLVGARSMERKPVMSDKSLVAGASFATGEVCAAEG